jgi:hypothetical protein
MAKRQTRPKKDARRPDKLVFSTAEHGAAHAQGVVGSASERTRGACTPRPMQLPPPTQPETAGHTPTLGRSPPPPARWPTVGGVLVLRLSESSRDGPLLARAASPRTDAPHAKLQGMPWRESGASTSGLVGSVRISEAYPSWWDLPPGLFGT